MYVASFCSLYFIWFFIRMLQVCLSERCIRFIHMLQVFYRDVTYVLQCFFQVFASVWEACFKCFICLYTYVANVASLCFKSRSSVAYGDARGKREGARALPRAVWRHHGRCPGARWWRRAGKSECGERETEYSMDIRPDVRVLALCIENQLRLVCDDFVAQTWLAAN
jgi:hypothetical protein